MNDFPAVSTREWEEKINEDLKGADYEKRLVWQTPEGISVRPYYRSEHTENLPHMQALPGQFPYVRGSRIKDNDWVIRQDFEQEEISEANALAVKALERGAGAVGLNARGVQGLHDMEALLSGIDPKKAGIHLIHGKNYPELFNYLLQVAGNDTLRGSLNFDPLGYFVLYGKPYGDIRENMDQAGDLVEKAASGAPEYKVISINGQHYHNAGASIVQELAFMLAQGNEYLVMLTDKGLKAEELAPYMQFTMAIGSNYFMEIAKIRAARLLWARIVEQYGQGLSESGKMTLHAVTSNWNKSVYDPYVNMLRTTTEAMSASIAGIDSMTVAPFDSTYKKPDDFSLRMARNQQIILKEESYFNKVADPAAGSYYIETLTDSIAGAAWDVFVKIQETGGFIAAVESGYITEEIRKTCQKRDMDIALRRQVFIGTNQYPNPSERMLDKIQPTARLSDLGGLRPYRGAQAFEALRMAVESHEQKGFGVPKVFLFTYGNLAMRKARAGFSTNFFGVAGYQIVEGAGYGNVEKGIADALASSANIVVLCSSDEEYAELAVAATEIKRQSPKTQVVVAGNPTELIDQLNQAGVDFYIHLRTNLLDALTRFNEVLDIV